MEAWVPRLSLAQLERLAREFEPDGWVRFSVTFSDQICDDHDLWFHSIDKGHSSKAPFYQSEIHMLIAMKYPQIDFRQIKVMKWVSVS